MPGTKQRLKEQKEQANGEILYIGCWLPWRNVGTIPSDLRRLNVQLLSLQESAKDNGSCHLQ